MEGKEALKLQIEEYSHCRSREGKEVHWVYISDEETDREFVLETSRNWKISDLKIVFFGQVFHDFTFFLNFLKYTL